MSVYSENAAAAKPVLENTLAAMRGSGMAHESTMGRRQFLGAVALTAAATAVPRYLWAKTAAKRLAGVFPIGFTPINAQDQIDYEGLAAQVQFCRRGGVHGLAWPQIASGWTV